MSNSAQCFTIVLANIWQTLRRQDESVGDVVELAEHRKPRRGGGNKKGTRTRFGSVRQLPSRKGKGKGRWQARYVGPDGHEHRAPTTFETKGDATTWLSMQSAAITEHRWMPPAPEEPTPAPTFREYATAWLPARELKPRTRDEYRKLLGLPKPTPEDGEPARTRTRKDGRKSSATLLGYWGATSLDAITPATVRKWYATLDASKPTQRAHLYQLLRTVLGTAVEDGTLDTNPCTIKSAGRTKRVRRIEPATMAQLATIRENLDARWHALVDVAAWCALRFGEITALRRQDVDLDAGLLRVRFGVTWVDGKPVVGLPKSSAGVRDVTIPPHIVPGLRAHIKDYAEPGRSGLVFPAVGGGHLSHGTFYKRWREARAVAGREDLRLHDARHTGAVMAAQAGATVRELMDRLGHSSPTTALLYQHAADGRAAELARKLSAMAGHIEGER